MTNLIVSTIALLVTHTVTNYETNETTEPLIRLRSYSTNLITATNRLKGAKL